MNKDLYSNIEFTKLKEEINKEIQRRWSYAWWDPLVLPRVGQDRTPPITLPQEGDQTILTDKTYTIDHCCPV
jgi:hypothetical protein